MLSALLQLFFELSARYAKLDGALEVLFGEPLVFLAEVEIGSCEEHVGVVWFKRQGFVQVDDGELFLLCLGLYFSAYTVELGLVGMLVDEQRQAPYGFLRLAGVLEEDGHAELGSIAVGVDVEQALVVNLCAGVVAPLLVDVGAIEQGFCVLGLKVENLGVIEKRFPLVA